DDARSAAQGQACPSPGKRDGPHHGAILRRSRPRSDSVCRGSHCARGGPPMNDLTANATCCHCPAALRVQVGSPLTMEAVYLAMTARDLRADRAGWRLDGEAWCCAGCVEERQADMRRSA